MNKVLVTVYADTITDYPADARDFFDSDNMVDIALPLWVVKQWYIDNRPVLNGDDFSDWFSNCSTCEDTDGLYQYAKDLGLQPDYPKIELYTVEFTSTYQVWALDKDDAVRVAELQRDPADTYIYVDDEMYS